MILNNRKILVTGASRGIGRAITETFIQKSAKVVGVARDFTAWDEFPKEFSPVSLDLIQLDALP